MFELNEVYTEEQIKNIEKNRFNWSWANRLGLPTAGQTLLFLNHYREDHSYIFALIKNEKGKRFFRCIDYYYEEYNL